MRLRGFVATAILGLLIALGCLGSADTAPSADQSLKQTPTTRTESDASAEEIARLWGPQAAANMRALGLSVRLDPGIDGDHRRLTWSFPGEHASVSEVAIPKTTASGEAGSGPAGRVPLWLTTPLERRTVGPVTVVAASDAVAPWAVTAEAAWRRVSPWVVDSPGGRAAGGLIVEVAPDNRRLTQALAGADGEFSGVAAVTSSTDGSLAPDAPVHVFLDASVANPGQVTTEVLLAHELVHAVTRSPLHPGVPSWWREGYADYVAFADGGVPHTTRDAGLASIEPGRAVRLRRSAAAVGAWLLPSDRDFRRSSAWAYPASRWVVATVVDRLPERPTPAAVAGVLWRIDQRLAAGESADAVLGSEAGISLDAVTRTWWSRLQHWQA